MTISFTEAQWRQTHATPAWLPKFEKTALMAIDPDNATRLEGERLLKTWVKTKQNVISDLVQVIETTEDVRVLAVAVMYSRNAIFKLWTQMSEEVEFLEQVNSDQTGCALKETRFSQPQDTSITRIEYTIQGVLSFIESLILAGLHHWDGESQDFTASRNLVFFLVTQLIKKGWCESTGSTEKRFYVVVESVLNNTIAVLDRIGTCELLAVSHQDLMCIRLFTEICQIMQRMDIASLGIRWEDHQDAKKLFERKILTVYVQHLLASLCRITISENFQRTNPSFQLDRGVDISCFYSLLSYLSDALEVVLEWDFTYTKCDAVVFTEGSFQPVDDWYPLLFEFSCNNKTISVLEIVIEFYRFVRSLMTDELKNFNQGATLLLKAQNTVKRISRIRLARLKSRFVPPHVSIKDSHLYFTRLVYSPLFASLIDLVISSRFVDHVYKHSSSKDPTQRIAFSELTAISYCLCQIVENPEVDILTLFQFEDVLSRVHALDKCFNFLLLYTSSASQNAGGDETLSSSVEQVRHLYSTICASVLQQDTEALPWVAPFKESCCGVVDYVLTSNHMVFDIHDDDVLQPEVEENYTPTPYITPIPSSFINESLRQFALLGHCNPSKTCTVLMQTLERHFCKILQTNCTSHDTYTQGPFCEQLVCLVGYACYFLTHIEPGGTSTQCPPRIPQVFLYKYDSLHSQITDLFKMVLHALLQLLTDNGCQRLSSSSIVEGLFCATGVFLEAYFLKKKVCLDGSPAFPDFNHLAPCHLFLTYFTVSDFVREAFQGILICIQRVFQVMPMKRIVCQAATKCLSLMTSPYSCNNLIVWDLASFQCLIDQSIQYIVEPVSTPSQSYLDGNTITKLFKTFTFCTCVTEDEELIKSYYSPQATHAVVDSHGVGQHRFQNLVTRCNVIHDMLISITVELTTQQGSEANTRKEIPTARIKKMLAACVGIILGTRVNVDILLKWIYSIMEIIKPLTEKLERDISIKAVVFKFLYCVEQHFTSCLTPPDMTQYFLTTFQFVVENLCKTYASPSPKALDDDSVDDSTNSSVDDEEKDFRSVLYRVLRTLTNLLVHLNRPDLQDNTPQSSSTMSPYTPNTPFSALSMTPKDVSCCQFVLVLLSELNSSMRLQDILMNDALVHFLRLLLRLFEQYPDVVFQQITPALAMCYCEAISKSLLLPERGCQQAAFETLESCLSYLTCNQRKHNFVSFSLVRPDTSQDIFEEPGDTSSVICIFEHYVAQMALKVLLEAIALPITAYKKHEFYSTLLCDMFAFLSTKLYNLKRVLYQLKQLSCYNSLQADTVAERFLSKAMDPVISFFQTYSHTTQRAIESSQSLSLQRIKYLHLRTQFQQVYHTLIAAHRLDKN